MIVVLAVKLQFVLNKVEDTLSMLQHNGCLNAAGNSQCANMFYLLIKWGKHDSVV